METKRYRIYGQVFNQNETLFILKNGNSEIIKKSAKEISIDKNILNALCPNDAYIVGYVFASEQMLADTSNLIQEKINYH